jgi:hypothetical protein
VVIDRKAKRRFWAKVQKGKGKDACWWWSGAKAPSGQTQFTLEGKRIRAHQFSWLLHHGEIPEGMQVQIKCGNYCCVNPDHLKVGTPKEKETRKSRFGVCKVCGEEEDTKYIYDDGCRGCYARKYGEVWGDRKVNA